jgi:activator of HSP90 ATPase
MSTTEEDATGPSLRGVRLALRTERNMAIETQGIISKQVRLPASPHQVYEALLDSDRHAALTGAPAQINGRLGGDFSALDGYLTGLVSELLEDRHIVIACRPREDAWPPHHLSTATFMFKPDGGGCLLVFYQQEVPAAMHDLMASVWEQHYWRRLPAAHW